MHGSGTNHVGTGQLVRDRAQERVAQIMRQGLRVIHHGLQLGI
jgi:hypothetical protein